MIKYPLHKATHEEELLDFLPTQFKESPVFTAFLKVLVKQVQDLEDVVQGVFWWTQKNNATLAQLDAVGSIAGEPRGGRNDNDYRGRINSRIALNRSSGNIGTILTFVSNYGTCHIIELDEFKSCVYIFIEPGWTPDSLFLASLKKLVAAGITTCVVYVLNTYTPFTFCDADGEDPVGAGFSDAGTGGGIFGTLLV